LRLQFYLFQTRDKFVNAQILFIFKIQIQRNQIKIKKLHLNLILKEEKYISSDKKIL